MRHATPLQFLYPFAKLRKATISFFFFMSVRQFVRLSVRIEQLTHTRRSVMKMCRENSSFIIIEQEQRILCVRPIYPFPSQ